MLSNQFFDLVFFNRRYTREPKKVYDILSSWSGKWNGWEYCELTQIHIHTNFSQFYVASLFGFFFIILLAFAFAIQFNCFTWVFHYFSVDISMSLFFIWFAELFSVYVIFKTSTWWFLRPSFNVSVLRSKISCFFLQIIHLFREHSNNIDLRYYK